MTVLSSVAPNATDMIRADHARVLTTFHRYHADASPAARRAIVETLCLALEVHAQMEEEILYPAMASVDTASVAKLIPEHDRMRTVIGRLRAMDASMPEYDASVMELMREVLHHVADEETVLLPQAERVLGERLPELGARMLKRRLQLMAPHAGAIARNKARAMPKAGIFLAATAVLGGAFLFRQLRRQA